ncbi:MAG: helix-turn-helix transcriptional regulator [Flavobacteriaceae bacterium]|nr:helix-turn-helix transcriptional regulator [Flavobacteriaceae bacterium]
MKPIYEAIIPHESTSFKVETYGLEEACESAGWHIHPEFEIVYVKNGSGVLKIGQKTVPYENGVLVFLGGNIPHSDMGNKTFKNNKEVVIQFSKDFVSEKLKVFPEFKGIASLISRSRQVLIFGEAVKMELGDHFEHFQNLGPAERLVNFLNILNRLAKEKDYQGLFGTSMLHEFREKETDRLKTVFDFLNDHYHQKISTEAMAEHVGLTPNSFSRFFKKMTDRRFIDFVNEFRIAKAIDVLNEGNRTITEAMYGSGFNSPSYFAKQFSKYTEMTPSDYLTKNKLNG